MMKSVDQMLKILPVANEAGVKIVLGDDYGAGELEHGMYGDELDFYVKFAGIPPLDVLRWATRNGADMMDQGHELGAIKAGMLADLIVVEGNPIANISILKDGNNVSLVMKGGQLEKDRLGTGGRGFAQATS
jgi:imidazolonepropionase-like amidohydrolase